VQVTNDVYGCGELTDYGDRIPGPFPYHNKNYITLLASCSHSSCTIQSRAPISWRFRLGQLHDGLYMRDESFSSPWHHSCNPVRFAFVFTQIHSLPFSVSPSGDLRLPARTCSCQNAFSGSRKVLHICVRTPVPVEANIRTSTSPSPPSYPQHIGTWFRVQDNRLAFQMMYTTQRTLPSTLFTVPASQIQKQEVQHHPPPHCSPGLSNIIPALWIVWIHHVLCLRLYRAPRCLRSSSRPRIPRKQVQRPHAFYSLPLLLPTTG
jgi:hypothetical protein